jgi:hypothetical protein
VNVGMQQLISMCGCSNHDQSRWQMCSAEGAKPCHIVAGLVELAAFCGDAAAVAQQGRHTAEGHKHERSHGTEREEERMGAKVRMQQLL